MRKYTPLLLLTSAVIFMLRSETFQTALVQSRDLKQYKNIFFRSFKTDLSGKKWCWQRRSTIHTVLVKKGDSHGGLNCNSTKTRKTNRDKISPDIILKAVRTENT